MMRRPLLPRAARRRALGVTLAPLLAAAAVVAWPCDCHDHPTHGVDASLAAAHSHSSHPTGHNAAPTPGSASAAHAATGEQTQAHRSSTEHPMAFEVGTAARPLVARGPRGPLWQSSVPSSPGTSKHGTPAEQTVARQLERLRQPQEDHDVRPAVDAVAERTVLTTRAATTQLSKRCQRLIKASRRSLTRKEKQARLRCVRDRRALVSRANQLPGVSAPAAPIQGPEPTTAPPAAGAPAPSPAPAPTTPAANAPTAPPSPSTPAKQYAAAGVIATDGDDPFRLTRASATADIVNFELDNTDRQDHDLYIAPASANGDVTGPLVKIIDRIEGGTRASADVELAPGRYKLICTVPGHGPMAVNFTVYAPA